jgi:class 3 adenylate cyclase
VEAQTRLTEEDVLITDAVRHRLRRDHGGWEECAAAELKGKREAVRLYAPSDRQEEPWPTSSSAAPAEPTRRRT